MKNALLIIVQPRHTNLDTTAKSKLLLFSLEGENKRVKKTNFFTIPCQRFKTLAAVFMSLRVEFKPDRRLPAGYRQDGGDPFWCSLIFLMQFVQKMSQRPLREAKETQKKPRFSSFHFGTYCRFQIRLCVSLRHTESFLLHCNRHDVDKLPEKLHQIKLFLKIKVCKFAMVL